MTQTRKAILLVFNDLSGGLQKAAGQKTRGDWQALPGARLLETAPCL
jgi:hypothetical protein